MGETDLLNDAIQYEKWTGKWKERTNLRQEIGGNLEPRRNWGREMGKNGKQYDTRNIISQ